MFKFRVGYVSSVGFILDVMWRDFVFFGEGYCLGYFVGGFSILV